MYLEVVAGARGLSASGVRKDPKSAVKVKKIWTLEAKLTSISSYSQYNSGTVVSALAHTRLAHSPHYRTL